jgi:hypothetical protein
MRPACRQAGIQLRHEALFLWVQIYYFYRTTAKEFIQNSKSLLLQLETH